MTAVEQALEIERRGAAFYEELATQAEQPLAKELFAFLADDDAITHRSFAQIAETLKLPAVPTAQSSSLEDRVRRAFARLGAAAHQAGKVEGLEAALELERIVMLSIGNRPLLPRQTTG